MGSCLCMTKDSKDASETSDCPPDSMLEMLNLISDLQSERIDTQRAELSPVSATTLSTGASLPGLRPLQTTSTRPEEDFMDMIARAQAARLEDQRAELPAAKPKQRPQLDDDFLSLIMRAQSGRMEDQRASIPVKKPAANKPSNSKK